MSAFAPRVWFITGTSTGLGRAVAEVALENGEIVVATARRPSSLDDFAHRYPKERLLVLPLDVIEQDQVVTAFAEAARTFGRIDVVLNNAAYGYVGELEGMEETKARSLFETNFWGAVRVTKEAVKYFRETNPPGVGGRLLQVSSYGGIVGIPGGSIYGATKFGWIRTEWARSATWAPEHPAYTNPDLYTTYVRRVGFDTAVTTWKDAKRSAEAIYKVACVPNPPLHFLVGKDVIEGTRKKVAALLADIDAYEALSEGLEG
ncbi:hypothetical protein GSI_02702 [Ganoderma sinense ZZ0214-1]|uniref:Uncharacterized protein n=1 Tax=Ganoderma sinense ZZ0214-1 TaxID=1077348 RepID=A0A2G8SMC4_9APHY|nr:hypothetical protein GSI_02702 [Ganoderma sinense ZZ0214-1]